MHLDSKDVGTESFVFIFVGQCAHETWQQSFHRGSPNSLLQPPMANDHAAVPLLSHAPEDSSNHTDLHTMESALGEKALTPVEKKCLLIEQEMDACGMGKYQWQIWFLCGFGYLIDLLWAQAFGLVLGPLGQELGFQGNESGNISVAFSSGLTIGAFTWGVSVFCVF